MTFVSGQLSLTKTQQNSIDQSRLTQVSFLSVNKQAKPLSQACPCCNFDRWFWNTSYTTSKQLHLDEKTIGWINEDVMYQVNQTRKSYCATIKKEVEKCRKMPVVYMYIYMQDSKIRVQCWGEAQERGMKAGDYPWRWEQNTNAGKEIRQAHERGGESWTDTVTYCCVDSCVVRVINERLVENKTLVLLWADIKQAERHTAKRQPNLDPSGLLMGWLQTCHLLNTTFQGYWLSAWGHGTWYVIHWQICLSMRRKTEKEQTFDVCLGGGFRRVSPLEPSEHRQTRW